MTMLEQTYKRLQTLPESKIRAIWAYIQIIAPEEDDKSNNDGLKDYQEMQALRDEVCKKIPKDFDPQKAYEEAIEEKYGSFI